MAESGFDDVEINNLDEEEEGEMSLKIIIEVLIHM